MLLMGAKHKEKTVKNILIIDDDEDILETTAALLTGQGYQVTSAATVEEGIKAIGEMNPAIVLLDVMFPEKKTRGFEAAQEIKQKYPKIKRVFVEAEARGL